MGVDPFHEREEGGHGVLVPKSFMIPLSMFRLSAGDYDRGMWKE